MKPSLNRRELLTAAATAACLACLGDVSSLLADATSQPSPPLDVGLKTDFKADGITSTWMPTQKVAIIRHGGKIYATSVICTHRGATLNTPDGQTFSCPRHHAGFDIDGKVTKPPAKSPLPRFAISMNADGHVIVDKSRRFTSDQWDDPASFISVA